MIISQGGRDQLGDFLLGPHRRRMLDGEENWKLELMYFGQFFVICCVN